MGSQAPLSSNESANIHILVTGFGPFGPNTINPSYLIARALPATVTPSSSLFTTIHIHAHPSPLRVSYADVRNLVPQLLFPSSDRTPLKGKERPNFDVVLFIGLAQSRDYFTFENLAHRDGYGKEKRDVDGETLEGDQFWKPKERGEGQDGFEAPVILRTGFNCDKVLKRWKGAVGDIDVRPSSDAGNYLCDFTYFTGLAEYWRRNPEGERPVAFLHVPEGVDDVDIATGTKVTLELIQALVEDMARGESETSSTRKVKHTRDTKRTT